MLRPAHDVSVVEVNAPGSLTRVPIDSGCILWATTITASPNGIDICLTAGPAGQLLQHPLSMVCRPIDATIDPAS